MRVPFAHVREAPRRLEARRCVVLQILPRTSIRSFRPPPINHFSLFSFLLLFILISSLAILKSQALGSVVPFPSPPEKQTFSSHSSRKMVLFTRSCTRPDRNTRCRNRRLRVAPELDKILLRKTSHVSALSSTSPAIHPSHFSI